jgi:hypothetical protein
MKIRIIELNCLWSDFQRDNRERFWIKELRVLHPEGHSVEILETVVRQSEVLAPRKKWIFCKVTPVSIQAFELSKVFP